MTIEIQIPNNFVFKMGTSAIEDAINKQIGKLYTDVISAITNLPTAIMTLPVYTDNSSALSGGLVAGQMYRTNGNPDIICIVH
jgi:hypothetical protein